MDIYFSRQSLSHFKVDEDNHQIIICLLNGEELIVDTYEYLMKWTIILTKMLKEHESYYDVVRYDTNNRKLYF